MVHCNIYFALHKIVMGREKCIPCQRLMPTEANEAQSAALSYGSSTPK
jgi:hypothetical protein